MSLGVCVHFPRKHVPMCKAQHKDHCSKHNIHHHCTRHINQPFHSPWQLYLKVSFLSSLLRQRWCGHEFPKFLVSKMEETNVNSSMGETRMRWATIVRLSDSPGITHHHAKEFQLLCVHVEVCQPAEILSTVITGRSQWSPNTGQEQLHFTVESGVVINVRHT